MPLSSGDAETHLIQARSALVSDSARTSACDGIIRTLGDGAETPGHWKYSLWTWLAFSIDCNTELEADDSHAGAYKVSLQGQVMLQTGVNCGHACCGGYSNPLSSDSNHRVYDCLLERLIQYTPSYDADLTYQTWCPASNGAAWEWAIPIWTDSHITNATFEPCAVAIFAYQGTTNAGGWGFEESDPSTMGSDGTQAKKTWENVMNMISSSYNAACLCPSSIPKGMHTSACSGAGICNAGDTVVVPDLMRSRQRCRNNLGETYITPSQLFSKMNGDGLGLEGCFSGQSNCTGGCICAEGMAPPDCGHATNHSCPTKNGVRCSGNGTCNKNDTHNKCYCNAGYDGSLCDVTLCPHDPSTGSTCYGNGVCRNGVCRCKAGFTGIGCETTRDTSDDATWTPNIVAVSNGTGKDAESGFTFDGVLHSSTGVVAVMGLCLVILCVFAYVWNKRVKAAEAAKAMHARAGLPPRPYTRTMPYAATAPIPVQTTVPIPVQTTAPIPVQTTPVSATVPNQPASVSSTQ